MHASRRSANNLQDLLHKYSTAEGLERTQLATVIGTLTDLGIMLRVRQLFTRTLVAVGIAVPLVASAAVAYAYLSNPLDPTKAVNCISYYTNLHTLASDSPGLVAALQQNNAEPLPIKIDAQSRACGVSTNTELVRMLTLSHSTGWTPPGCQARFDRRG